MKFEWKPLGEIAEVTKLAGFEFTKYINYIEDGEIIALRALNIRRGELDLSNVKRISKKISEKLSRSKINRNDILLTYTGNSYGNCAIIDESDKYHLAPNVCKIVPNQKLIDPYFLYCYINSTGFHKQMKNNVSGSAQPTIPMKAIRTLTIPVPKINVQKNISKKIKLLDRKVRENKKLNDNLKLTLTTIFESQINSFGFDEANLTDIATYKNGLAMQKYRPKPNEQSLPVLKIKELNQGYTDTSSDRCSAKIDEDVTVHTGDIIFSWSGTLLVKNWSGKTAGLNQHLFKVTSKNYPDWFIYEWTKHHLRKFQSIAAGKATTMGHIKRSDLASSRVIIPDKNSLAKLDAIMKPLYDKRIEIIKENQRLIEIKKMLLQKYF